MVEKEAVCLWHLGEELRDLGAPRANPVIHLARISQKQPNIFSPTEQQDLHPTKCFSELKNVMN